MKFLVTLPIAVLLTACVAGAAFSQPRQSPSTSSFAAPSSKPRRTPNDTLVSPTVTADGRVTFRIYAPQARTVILRGNSDFFQTPPQFAKDDQGIWSATTEAAAPGAYRYNFVVDGATVLDSRNPDTSSAAGSVQSLVEIPGGADDVQAERAGIAHGTISTVYYDSPISGGQRRLHLYLPPDYDKGRNYPVLYLIHGGGDDDRAWPSVGRAGFILDNLIAAGKAKPMVVVFPNGGVNGNQQVVSDPQTDPFIAELMTVIIPYIETRYRVSNAPEDRALAGLSLGGHQVLYIGLTHTRQFRYLGIFSSGLPNQPAFEEKYGKTLAQETSRLKLIWYGYGSSDPSGVNAKRTMKMFDSYGMKYQSEETPGGHVWTNWRLYLSQFAQLLFR